MKPILFFLLLFLAIVASCGDKKQIKKELATPKTSYDSLLARKLGADAYGMRRYVMAFLKAGKVVIKDSVKKADLQLKHMQNIQKMKAQGKLIVAGPFLDNQPLRGIFIFNVESLEEAKKLVATDPAIQAGTLEMELHPWYGSAALIETVKIHQSIEKKDIIAQ